MSTTTVPTSIFANVNLNSAPFPVESANITLVRSEFSSSSPQNYSSPSSQHGSTLDILVRINPSSSDRLQWDRATAQFAKYLAFSSPVVAHSVFAPTRHLEYAPWSVSVGGVNDSELTMRLVISSCIDMPRRESDGSSSALNLDIKIPPSMTRPVLSAPLAVHRAVFPQHEDSAVTDSREIIGAIVFAILFLIVLVLLFKLESGASALELLWTIQILLIVADSPCSKQSFFSFSKHVFWILRWAVEPRSIVPAIIHSSVLVVGLLISYLLSIKSSSPQRRLLHPRLGVFFIAILLLGGIHTNMTLMLGGVPDRDYSLDTTNRAIGLVFLIITLLSTILFCWSATGSLSLKTMVVTPATGVKSTFFVQNIWRPVTMWRRNSPITGIYSNLAYLPPKLNYLSNFLPFFISLMVNIVTAVFLSVDPSNIGGCLATITCCIAISSFYMVYVLFGSQVCRNRAWSTFVALCYAGRVLWMFSAIVHLDCNGDSASIAAASTSLAVIALVLVFAGSVIGIITANTEAPLKSNRLKKRAIKNGMIADGSGMMVANSPMSSPKTKEILAEDLPTIAVSHADEVAVGKENNNNKYKNNNNMSDRLDSDDHSLIILDSTTGNSSTSNNNNNPRLLNPLNLSRINNSDSNNSLDNQQYQDSDYNQRNGNDPFANAAANGIHNSNNLSGSSSLSPSNFDRKRRGSIKALKGLPPSSPGTGERPQSPMYGGVQRKGFATPGSPYQNRANRLHHPHHGENVSSSLASSGNLNASGNAGKNSSFPALSLRDQFLNIDDHNTNNNNSNAPSINPNSALAVMQRNQQDFEQNQRSRGESMESRLSSGSGSGGHHGQKQQRSPSGSFGRGIASHSTCPRCGTPTRLGPAGMKQLCPNCKTQMGASASASAASQLYQSWELPTTSDRVLFGSDQQEMITMPSSLKSNNNNNNKTSTSITLPSYQPTSSEEASGILQLPSYQVKNSSGTTSNSNNNQNKDDDSDVDWL